MAYQVTFGGVLSETNRIINSRPSHFLVLSVLFVIPLAFSAVIYPSLSPPTSVFSSYHRFLVSYFVPDSETPPVDKSVIVNTAIYCLIVLFFSLMTTASITYTTFHGFYGKPVKFVSSLRSALFSFFPLLGTYIVSHLIKGFTLFCFGSFMALVISGLTLFGFEVDYENSYFQAFSVLITFFLACILIYFHLEWYLANVVVVVESQWGVAPLKRSSYLVKGMRSLAFLISCVLGSLLSLSSVLFSWSWADDIDYSGESFSFSFFFWTFTYTSAVTILMLYSVAANTVLFKCCKALRGELDLEMVNEFSGYVSLPTDNANVSKVVYAV